jgi:hypothetical protein
VAVEQFDYGGDASRAARGTPPLRRLVLSRMGSGFRFHRRGSATKKTAIYDFADKRRLALGSIMGNTRAP